MKYTIEQALNNTWQAIGHDILEATGGEAIPRADVVEVVLDANYLEMYGGLSADEVKAFRALSYNKQKAIARNAFPFGRYG